MLKYFYVAIGGALGAIARFAVGAYVGNRMGSRWPYGTLIINLTGSFLLGVIMTVLAEHTNLSRAWVYLLPIGFIGAYTTFSTFEFETFRLVQDGQVMPALMNIGLSVVAGFAMVWLGIIAGKTLR